MHEFVVSRSLVLQEGINVPMLWAQLQPDSGLFLEKNMTFCLSHSQVEFFHKDRVKLLRVPDGSLLISFGAKNLVFAVTKRPHLTLAQTFKAAEREPVIIFHQLHVPFTCHCAV